MTTKTKERRCTACGTGIVRRSAKAGRVDVYKGLEFALPADLVLTACEACGERYTNLADAEKIDAALSEAYAAHVRTRIEASIGRLQEAGLSLATVEKELGLSEGYLSKIRKSVEPSFQLVALLAVIAENPKKMLSTIHALRA